MYNIYIIHNKNTGKFYVGRTGNYKNRWKSHRTLLRRKVHPSKYLQDSWNKHGEDKFEFYIMEELSTLEESIEMEQMYLEDYLHETYNRCSNSMGGGDYISNHPNKEEIIKKISNTLKITYGNMTFEEKIEKYSMPGIDNPMYGKKHTEETRKKISDKVSKHYENHGSYRKGKTFVELFGEEKSLEMKKELSDNASKRTGENNPFYGKKHTEETKKKISDNTKGRIPSNTRKVMVNGIEYESATKAGKLLGVVTATITHRIKSNNRLYDGYFYKDEM